MQTGPNESLNSVTTLKYLEKSVSYRWIYYMFDHQGQWSNPSPNIQLGDDLVEVCAGGTGHQFERRQKHCKETWRTGAFQNSGWIIVAPVAFKHKVLISVVLCRKAEVVPSGWHVQSMRPKIILGSLTWYQRWHFAWQHFSGILERNLFTLSWVRKNPTLQNWFSGIWIMLNISRCERQHQVVRCLTSDHPTQKSRRQLCAQCVLNSRYNNKT